MSYGLVVTTEATLLSNGCHFYQVCERNVSVSRERSKRRENLTTSFSGRKDFKLLISEALIKYNKIQSIIPPTEITVYCSEMVVL